MGKIFYIMGKSASGKDKIYSRLAGNKELNLKKLILYTTRPVRDGEENGKQYYFTDEKNFRNLRQKEKSSKQELIIQYTVCGLISRQMMDR
ncbi:Guanylate kinase [Blautia obeum A2-162]|uniref:Guanylate kinase n=1 Tax=Blautia obeum A2-162 TaxID=657314 RepID=D4LY92_9FIRM|nr:guanylate kinase [Blautia obeum]CBL22595.1 Guanylate kinase [Blautia obeum A2-162]